ncbi:site-specific DNA-methyltransferase [Rhodovulum sulfidophilum]|uniref:site-specific DNA-methyltransferase n=1 Tax=Rhodovulum sulfidophilum TaxID=35806 RepID=UPI0019285113|nr:site-specific DNA-methyltransferase [Rhodovulum sulfidophilum]MBL3587079.1 site-specific DNA-methyltransferase [Rhodovulum sulfidophilum]
MPLLNWLTRDEDLKAADHVPYRLLDEVPELSRGEGAEGLLVQGDNLEALKALLPFYAGRVKCIYIDPPYNTRSAFEHYDDSLEHAKWLAMIVPRLMLLREFLSEDGSIWVSIDDNEGHYLKVIMDEIFGRRNFVVNVLWQKRIGPDNRVPLGDAHDHIHVYGKDRDKFRAGANRIPLTEKQRAQFKNPDNDPRGPWTSSSNFSAQGYRPNQMYEIRTPGGAVQIPPKGRCWVTIEPEFQRLMREGRMWFGSDGNGMPRKKTYLNEHEGRMSWSWWTNDDVGNTQESKKEINAIFADDVFDTPKPERLLQRILHIATNPGDLVLDSFLGSGTTAAVAHKMGRRWIGIEMGEHARTHCALRLEKVIEGEQGGISKDVDWQGGGGFRFCRLGKAVYDAQGRIDDSIRFADLARHVWFSETRQPLTDPPESPVLGVHEGRAVALLFNGILKDRTPRGGNVLTRPVLRLIREALPEEFDGDLVVYGTACRLSAETLKHEGILFRQTPYDLAVRV